MWAQDNGGESPLGRVAITGLGTINPIALTLNEYEMALKELRVGIQRITKYDPVNEIVQIAAEVRGFEATEYMEKKKAKRYDPVIKYAIAASKMALEDSGLDMQGSWKTQAAVTVSSGIGGIHTMMAEFDSFQKFGSRFTSPFLIPMMIPDMSAGAVAMEFGLQGPNFATISACATSLHSIIITAMMIRHGYIQVGICGGAEAVISPLPIAAFANMMALSRNNEDPAHASRPFDQERDGFVMGEGAGVLVLEDLSHALNRKARIYGFIDGFGMSGDAYDFSAIEPGGETVARAMNHAIAMAGVAKEDIDLVNCHATSTPRGDKSELIALQNLYSRSSKRPALQSTKAMIGHGLGAAGANEVIACILQTQRGFVHGTANLCNPDPQAEGFWIPTQTIEKPIRFVLKNSLGFGGHNASILLSKD